TREFYTLVKKRLSPGGAGASHITRLSTLATFRAVFPMVDVYPDWKDEAGAQSIIVAAPGGRPAKDALLRRAVALQERHHFHYPLPDLVNLRVTDQSDEGSAVL